MLSLNTQICSLSGNIHNISYLQSFYYRDPNNISEANISIFKGLFAFVNFLFIVASLIASAFNKASITDMDLDPDEIS